MNNFQEIYTEDELLKELISKFMLKDVSYIKQIPTVRNKVYSLKSNAGHHIFKLSKLENSKKLLNQNHIVKQVSKRNGPVPIPFLLDYNDIPKIILNKEDYVVHAYEYIKGRILNPNTEYFYEFGKSIGQFHKITDNFEKSDHYPYVTISNLVISPIEAIKKFDISKKHIHYLEKFPLKIIPLLKKYDINRFKGVVHGDSHHHNAIVTENNQVLLIDFEDVCWQWRAFDLATAIWGTLGKGNGNLEIWNALLVGYKSVHYLDKEEENLIRYLIAIRHLWWLGFRAENWNNWKNEDNCEFFFQQGLDMLVNIVENVCEIKIDFCE